MRALEAVLRQLLDVQGRLMVFHGVGLGHIHHRVGDGHGQRWKVFGDCLLPQLLAPLMVGHSHQA